MRNDSMISQEASEDAPDATVWAMPIVSGMLLGCFALWALHWARDSGPHSQWLLHFRDGLYRGIVYGIGFAIGVLFALKIMQLIADWRELRELRIRANQEARIDT